MRRGADVGTVLGALWALRALRATRRALADGQVRDVRVPAPPPLPASAERGVLALLDRKKPTCLERALVRQRWLAAQGDLRAVIIGVTAPSQGFLAHAWIAGEPDALAGQFHELTRIQP